MFTRFDKAGAAVLAGALTSLLSHFTILDGEIVAAVGTLLSAVLVYLVPNKAVA